MTDPVRTLFRLLFVTITCLTISAFHDPLRGGEGPPFPRTANYYLFGFIDREDVRYLAGWDLDIFNWYVDRDAPSRQNIAAIKTLNPNALMLIYHLSTGVNATINPPDPLDTAAAEYDWWLYDYQGDPLWDMPPWQFNRLLNFTDESAASGSHPEGLRANDDLPRVLLVEHLEPYRYWDGVFYDVFSDNLRWMYPNVKDANVNGIPEYDTDHNQNEPLFDNIWRNGMLSLARNTLMRAPGAVIVGNGLHRTATPYLNGRMLERYRRGINELSDLSSLQMYADRTGRERPVLIVDGVISGDPPDYASMRFGLLSALLIDAFYSSTHDFTTNRSQALWFDEFSVTPSGRVAAASSALAEAIDDTQVEIRLDSTKGFPAEGIVTLGGEQVYYASKTADRLMECRRGYPHIDAARSAHAAGTPVIHYQGTHTGYLGYPTTDAFDVNQPSVRLPALLRRAGWFADEETAAQINSRVWGRIFQNGMVILNPTPGAVTVTGLGNGVLRRIEGLQDPAHNDGTPVKGELIIGARDGFILVR